MGKIIVNVNLTLDGVMQAPGRADEDTRGGFKYGGWGAGYFDPAVMGPGASEGSGQRRALLFGRRTYQDFYSVWPGRTDNPFSAVLDNAAKYVASRTLDEPLPWMNSKLLKGEATETVPELKRQVQEDLLILGCGMLVQSLMQANLIDEFVLSIYPLVLGSGRRLFADGSPFTKFQLVDTKIASTGVVIATYRPLPGPPSN
jgi:dihydrofolate reductase